MRSASRLTVHGSPKKRTRSSAGSRSACGPGYAAGARSPPRRVPDSAAGSARPTTAGPATGDSRRSSSPPPAGARQSRPAGRRAGTSIGTPASGPRRDHPGRRRTRAPRRRAPNVRRAPAARKQEVQAGSGRPFRSGERSAPVTATRRPRRATSAGPCIVTSSPAAPGWFPTSNWRPSGRTDPWRRPPARRRCGARGARGPGSWSAARAAPPPGPARSRPRPSRAGFVLQDGRLPHATADDLKEANAVAGDEEAGRVLVREKHGQHGSPQEMPAAGGGKRVEPGLCPRDRDRPGGDGGPGNRAPWQADRPEAVPGTPSRGRTRS